MINYLYRIFKAFKTLSPFISVYLLMTGCLSPLPLYDTKAKFSNKCSQNESFYFNSADRAACPAALSASIYLEYCDGKYYVDISNDEGKRQIVVQVNLTYVMGPVVNEKDKENKYKLYIYVGSIFLNFMNTPLANPVLYEGFLSNKCGGDILDISNSLQGPSEYLAASSPQYVAHINATLKNLSKINISGDGTVPVVAGIYEVDSTGTPKNFSSPIAYKEFVIKTTSVRSGIPVLGAKTMNITNYSNSATSISNQSSIYARNPNDFQDIYKDVWGTNSEINVTNANIGSSAPMADFLIDANGSGLLYLNTIIKPTPPLTYYTSADLLQLIDNFEYHLKNYHQAVLKSTPVTSYSILEFEISSTYLNTIGLAAVHSFKVVEVENDTLKERNIKFNINGDTLDVNQALERLVRSNSGQTAFGITLKANKDDINPMCLIYRNNIRTSMDAANRPDLYDRLEMATVMHELAHAWYDIGISLPPHSGGDCKEHAPYIYGDGATYCLFKSSGCTDPYDLVLEKMKQMRFSKGVRQRLANVFSVTQTK